MLTKVFVEGIQANKLTANNRIYSEAAMRKIVEESNKRIKSGGLFIVDSITPTVDLNAVWGDIKKCRYDEESSKIAIEVTEFSKLKEIGLANLLSKNFRITPNIIGDVDSDGNVRVDDVVAYVVIPNL